MRFIYIVLIILMITFFIITTFKDNNNQQESIVIDHLEFIEMEFDRQIPRQLNDGMNIVLFLDEKYSGEVEDKLIEEKAQIINLNLKNIIFYNQKVIYEFTLNN